MNNMLFFITPLAVAVAMVLWMAHCRKPGRTGFRRYWLLHWMACSLSILLLDVDPDNSALRYIITMVAFLGMAAFAGGGAYLILGNVLRRKPTSADVKRSQSGGDDESNDELPWSISNTIRAERGIFDRNNGYGAFVDDD